MRPAQGLASDVLEGAVGCPGGVGGDAGEERQDPGGLHPGLAALGVDGEQRVPADAEDEYAGDARYRPDRPIQLR
jgi:hypothetical protein